jgi:phage shock protein A
MKLQAAENNLSGFKEQYSVAVTQAEDAKRAVEQNAMRLQELTAKKMELVGKLQQAKMQDAVNKTVESISASMETEAPSFDRVEDKINERLAHAKAQAELHEATPEGAESELREAISVTQADAKLDELRKELGLET